MCNRVQLNKLVVNPGGQTELVSGIKKYDAKMFYETFLKIYKHLFLYLK